MRLLEKANRISPSSNILNYVRYIEDFPVQALDNFGTISEEFKVVQILKYMLCKQPQK